MTPDPDPTPESDPKPDPVKPTNDEITDRIFDALAGDENLTDDDRRSIAEGVITKAGGEVPKTVKPEADHWSVRKLW